MTEPTTFTARCPEDLVALAPQVLGFHPHDSVVLLTFGGGQAFHARVDLPDDGDQQAAVVAMLADVVVRHEVPRVALLLYTDDPWTAASFHDCAAPRFAAAGVEVIDVIRVAAGRFHAARDVDDPGTSYDLTSHVFTAEQVVRGQVVHASRAALAATLEPVDEVDAAAVAAAAERFGRQLDARDLVTQARWAQRKIRRHLRLGTPLSVADAGRLLALVAVVPVRDIAWAEITRPDAERHVELWRGLVRRCPPRLLPAPSCLLAFAAWLNGHGALAWCALDRCALADPAYTMADCIAGMLEGAVPPSAWTPLSEEDVWRPLSPDALRL